jgi:hypothetical protein
VLICVREWFFGRYHELPRCEGILERGGIWMLWRKAICGDEDLRVATIAQTHCSVSVGGRRAHEERSTVKVEDDPGWKLDGTDRFNGKLVDATDSRTVAW